MSWRQRSGEGWHVVGRGGEKTSVSYLHDIKSCVVVSRTPLARPAASLRCTDAAPPASGHVPAEGEGAEAVALRALEVGHLAFWCGGEGVGRGRGCGGEGESGSVGTCSTARAFAASASTARASAARISVARAFAARSSAALASAARTAASRASIALASAACASAIF